MQNHHDDLSVRQKSIDLLKGRLKDQIMSLKETIAEVLDKDTSLADKIRMLSREQGNTIASILMGIGMAIGNLAEVLLPGDTVGSAVGGTTCKPSPKDEQYLKE